MSGAGQVRVLVTVGTDKHPFDRLVGWVDAWAATRPEVEVLVQSGTAAAPGHVRHTPTFGHDELLAEMARADVIVTHGGPASIMEARRRGLVPIVVARDPAHGEHVDGHQLAFVGRLAQSGLVQAFQDREALLAALDRATADPASLALGAALDNGSASAARDLGALVDLLVDARRGADPVTVLYIGGLGRSGSTLLDRMLGQMPELVSAGEVVHLWERGLQQDEQCGCGRPFSGCEFWTEVGKLAFGGWDRVDAAAVLERQRRTDRTRHVLRLALPEWATPGPALGYADSYRRIYAAALEVGGARVAVDSSKHASLAFNLARHPGIDLRVVHVVRDPRGVAHSWSKTVSRPETGDRELMHRFTPTQTSLHWWAQNASLELLARRGVPTLRVRYEDLLADVSGTLLRIRELAGLPADPSSTGFLDGDGVTLAAQHTVAGNPMRFTTGRLRLVPDEQWRTAMPRAQRAWVAALTAPLRFRYGYRRGAR